MICYLYQNFNTFIDLGLTEIISAAIRWYQKRIWKIWRFRISGIGIAVSWWNCWGLKFFALKTKSYAIST